MPANIVTEFMHRQQHTYNLHFQKTKRLLISKFNQDKIHCIGNMARIQNNWVKNLTQTDIPNNVEVMLSLGPKFSVAPTLKDVSIKRLLAEVEEGVNTLKDVDKNITRSKITNIVTNYIHKNEKHDNVYNSLYRETHRFLRDHPDLIVTNSDKGNTTVIMNTEQYRSKTLELLNDNDVYKKLPKDPTSNIQRRANNLIKTLKQEHHINDDLARKLSNYKSVAPRFFATPKIHKENIPMRPIISTINSPTSHISKFMAGLLREAFSGYFKYSIKNSATFANLVNNKQLPPHYKIVSLDAVSLFTNISLQLVLDIIDEEWHRIQNITTIPKNMFIDIIEFIFQSNYFVNDNIFYKQLFGTPMGSSISSVLADITVTKCIMAAEEKLPFQFPFIYQYVDDLIMSIPEDANQQLLDTFNEFNQHLKFTIEEETERAVPFLDTKVIRSEQNLVKLDWYQKPTSSNRYVNASSYHNIKMKINVILNMKQRIFDIAHEDYRTSAINRLYSILRNNGYAKNFLRKLLYSTPINRPNIEQQITDDTTNEPQPPEIKYITLPHIETVTDKISRTFKQTNNSIRIARYNLVTNKKFYTKLKQKIDTQDKTDAVYQLTCECNQLYIGQTSQTTKQRMTQHKSDAKLRPGRCALATHVNNTGHAVDYEHLKILETEKNLSKRTFLEMCHINDNIDRCMNSKTDVNNLSNIYSYLLSRDSRGSVVL